MKCSITRSASPIAVVLAITCSLWAPIALAQGGGFAACVAVNLSEDSLLDFGKAEVGYPKTRAVTVTNVGSTGSVHVNLTALGDHQTNGRLVLLPTGVTIPMGGSQSFAVVYDPLDLNNHLKRELEFSIENPACGGESKAQVPPREPPTLITVLTRGIATMSIPPSLTLSETVLDFGEMDVDSTPTVARSLTVSTVSNSPPMTVTLEPGPGSDPQLSYAPSTFSLGGTNQSQLVIVTYTPTETGSLAETLSLTASYDAAPHLTAADQFSVTGEVYKFLRMGVSRPGFIVLAAYRDHFTITNVTFFAEHYNNIGIGNDAATAAFGLQDLSRGISWEVTGAELGWSGEGDFGPVSLQTDRFDGPLEGTGDAQGWTWWETYNASPLPCGNICNPDQSIKFILKVQ